MPRPRVSGTQSPPGKILQQPKTVVSTLEISKDEFERFVDEVWCAISALDEIAERLCNPEDQREKFALTLIHRTHVLVDDSFDGYGEMDECNHGKEGHNLYPKIFNGGSWTENDVDTYEAAFEPFRAFVSAFDFDGDRTKVSFWRIAPLAVLINRTVNDGISLFRSRLADASSRV